jgi:hypothetical protein
MTVRYTIFRLLVKLNHAAREFPRNITFALSAQLCGKGHKHIYQTLHMKLHGILLVYWDSEKNAASGGFLASSLCQINRRPMRICTSSLTSGTN